MSKHGPYRFCANLGATSGRNYYYPDRQPFHRLAPERGQVLSWIGDNPDLLILKRLAVFAGNPLAALLQYINTGAFPAVLSEFCTLLVRMVWTVIGEPDPTMGNDLFAQQTELRRDFHALGFAYLTVKELDRCVGGGRVDLSEIEALAVQGASALVAGQVGKTEQPAHAQATTFVSRR